MVEFALGGLRVLVVTGILASGMVKEVVSKVEVNVDVEVLPKPVAALMSLKYIALKLKERGVSGYDYILVPGMIPGDTSIVEAEVGIPTFKGPKHAVDLPIVLEALKRGERLSKELPACVLLQDRVLSNVEEELKKLEDGVDRSKAVKVGRKDGVWVSGGPLRIIAEVLDTPTLSLDEVLKRATRFVDDGVDIIDLGMLSEEPRPKDVSKLVKAVKRRLNVPVSIDTLDEEEVKEGLKAKVDLVLSLTPSIVERADKLLEVNGAKEASYVVVPFDPREGRRRGIEERVELLMDMVKELREVGFRKVLVDPLMDPPISPGFLDALIACRMFNRQMPNVPVVLGVGNVTELVDADSQGVNAILAILALEAGASILLTTEGSVKTRGSVRELVIAAKMASLAKARNTPPKDLGLNLLLMKEKKVREEVYVKPLGVEVVEARGRGKFERDPFERDPAGSFKVMVDRGRNLLTLLHFKNGSVKPSLVIEGKRAFDLRDTIVERELVASLEHAFYLGYELAKAELALLMGRSYVQDEDLITKF